MDIISKIREAGIVGEGGAGFPTHVKVNCKAECVIANGAYKLSLYVSAALGEYGVCDPILALTACAGVSAIAAGLTILVSKR